MGKNLIQQRRGKGSIFKSPSFKFKGKAKNYRLTPEAAEGSILDLIHCPGHSAPLAVVRFPEEDVLMIAPEGVRVGDKISSGSGIVPDLGNTLPLSDIPEGTVIFNIETQPGDGGKLVRSSGVFATLLQKTENKVIIMLPSKKTKSLDAKCRATIGRVAGGGRTEKPIVKAGNMHYKRHAKRKLFPVVCGVSKNAVDHPFGGSSSHTKGRPLQCPRNAPPGRKVGKLWPRRTGRKR